MEILFIIICYLLSTVMLYFLGLLIPSGFLCSRDNIFNSKISNIIKFLMFIPLLNLLLAFITVIVRFCVFVKEDLEELNNKNK